MSGYYLRHMAVELYKGEWILRAALPGDRPISDNEEAQRAMTAWLERNRERFTKDSSR